ncbi:MAG: hypothetical protein HY220_00935 [Candidatus Sungbacteria bacterium]|uniref:glucose-6-phosphate isomerase n=1 Tax=Candidatus Sungiibacteriota bacterium TaxID=2750080 RepID=A0A9D6LMY3_9BACT|nr:hypothetical protein [Candidatus Sungbacteria bacterium]
MPDLKTISGLPLGFEAGTLVIPHELRVGEMTEKKVVDLAPFFVDAISSDIDPVYRVWRDIEPMDKELSFSQTMRYDITLIESGSYRLPNDEREFFRTAGHYHQVDKNGIGYPEIYEVLSGRGHWLIQKAGGNHDEIEEAYLVEAGPGEKILVPPGFGHITINTESEPLIEANCVADLFQSDYSKYKKLHGGCYRFLAGQNPAMIEIERNPNYSSIPELKKLVPRKDWFHGYFEPLWNVFVGHPTDLQFLVTPETYRPQFFAISNIYKEIR